MNTWEWTISFLTYPSAMNMIISILSFMVTFGFFLAVYDTLKSCYKQKAEKPNYLHFGFTFAIIYVLLLLSLSLMSMTFVWFVTVFINWVS